MQTETVPAEKMSSFFMIINLGIMLAITACLFCGLPLVSMSESELKSTDFWMVTYGAPIVLSVLNILALLTIFREEPLEFLVQKRDMPKALAAINKIYDTDEPEEVYK